MAREIFIFWSGGFDSTFLVCKYHLEGNTVRPLYILNCDPRQNTQAELETVQRIASKLKLSPPLIFDAFNLTLDPDIIRESNFWFHRGVFTRPINQFGYMVQVGRNLQKRVVAGSVKEPEGFMHKLAPNNPQSVFNELAYPVLFHTKLELNRISLALGFADVLRETISCWFPVTVGGKYHPCGNCHMCRARLAFL